MSDFEYEGTVYDAGDLDVMIAPVIAYMAQCVEETNRANGWYDADRTFGDGIALIHSEVSEALEAYRDHGLKDRYKFTWSGDGYAYAEPGDTNFERWVAAGNTPKPEGVGSEFADILVRLLDESKRQDIDLGDAFIRKSHYNTTRGYRHGGKAL